MTNSVDLEAGPDLRLGAPSPEAGPAGELAAGRDLFRYVVAPEWSDYRAIMRVFADTFFAEFTPEDVTLRLSESGGGLISEAVADRLESLRRWGNLTVSSAIGNPQSIQDYYRRRSRYLITRAGQEVHHIVEGVLKRVDSVVDVSTARLRAMLEALERLAELDAARAEPDVLADAIGAVFDPHEAFTTEIAQLFAAINQWQSRYDLTSGELRFFAEVLVGYVGERLDEIERLARPIALVVARLRGSIDTLVERAGRGLAGRVDDAGLSASIAVRHRAGSRVQDWDNLCAWFLRSPARTSRIETLTRQAVAAVRTLTLNLTRLSRAGFGSASRRADFFRLAQFFDQSPAQAHQLATAAFGLAPTDHFGALAADAADPLSSAVAWWNAPPAEVPLSIRERGDATPRGRSSPIPDRTKEREVLERRRAHERASRERVDFELLDVGQVDECHVTAGALARIQELLGRMLPTLGTHGFQVTRIDGHLACLLERTPGRHTRIHSPDGVFTLQNLSIRFSPVSSPAPAVQRPKGSAGGV